MIGRLIDNLKQWVASAEAPVLAWSGGNDSTFLLNLMLEERFRFSVLTLPQLLTKQQKRFLVETIGDKRLSVFFYTPVRIDNHDGYVTADYLMGGTMIRRVMDHVQDDRCGIDAGQDAMRDSQIQPRYIWDLTIVGTKASDRHVAVSKFEFANVGKHLFLTPLWDWTDEQVVDAATQLGYRLNLSGDPKLDTGNFVACMECLNTDQEVYCPKAKQVIKGIKQSM